MEQTSHTIVILPLPSYNPKLLGFEGTVEITIWPLFGPYSSFSLPHNWPAREGSGRAPTAKIAFATLRVRTPTLHNAECTPHASSCGLAYDPSASVSERSPPQPDTPPMNPHAALAQPSA